MARGKGGSGKANFDKFMRDARKGMEIAERERKRREAVERQIARDREAAKRDAQKAEREAGRSTAFRTRERQDGSGKTDVLFNRPGDGAAHGHVVQHETDDGQTAYDHVRDEDGNVYTDE